MRMLNLWLPVQALRARPLAVLDSTTLDKRRDQLRYHIVAADAYGSRLNDCFAYLHNRTQRWSVHVTVTVVVSQPTVQ